MPIHFQSTLQTFKMPLKIIINDYIYMNQCIFYSNLTAVWWNSYSGASWQTNGSCPPSTSGLQATLSAGCWNFIMQTRHKHLQVLEFIPLASEQMHPTHAQIWMAGADCQSQLKFIVNEGSNSCLCFHKESKIPLKLQVSASAPLDSDAAAHSRTCNTQGLVCPHWKSN